MGLTLGLFYHMKMAFEKEMFLLSGSYEGHPISSDNDLIKRKLFL